jgi:predicted enzyme related to lactoylglutathione lyase
VSVQSTAPAASAVAGTDLAGVTVRDLQKALAFYRDTLGMQPSVVSERGAEFHLPDGTTFGIWQPEDGEFALGFSAMFAVGDAAESTKTIRQRGGEISDPFESPVCYMALSKDPEGNPVIVHQKKSKDEHRPAGQARTLTTIHGIDLAGYMVSDPQGAIAYYRDVLGLTPTDIDEDGRGAEFELADGSTFGVWMMPDKRQGGFVMFAVDSVRAKAAELRSRGVELSDVIETPNCLMAFGPDPEGNAVIIHQRKAHD